jgi:hypothetical protein
LTIPPRGEPVLSRRPVPAGHFTVRDRGPPPKRASRRLIWSALKI